MFWAFGEAQRQERRGCVLELREQGLRDSQDKQWELGGFRKVKARLLGPETRESRPAGGRVCRGGLEQRVSVSAQEAETSLLQVAHQQNGDSRALL